MEVIETPIGRLVISLVQGNKAYGSISTVVSDGILITHFEIDMTADTCIQTNTELIKNEEQGRRS